jgi:hypothetical protein
MSTLKTKFFSLVIVIYCNINFWGQHILNNRKLNYCIFMKNFTTKLFWYENNDSNNLNLKMLTFRCCGKIHSV